MISQLWENVSRFKKALEASMRSHLPALNFITIHYLYFIGTCLLTSVIFWGTSTPARSISYTDSLFIVVSAMTEAGLNTVNLSQMNTFQQWFIWMHIMAGSAIFVSLFVVHFRKRAFERRFKGIVNSLKAKRLERRETRRRSLSHPRTLDEDRDIETGDGRPNYQNIERSRSSCNGSVREQKDQTSSSEDKSPEVITLVSNIPLRHENGDADKTSEPNSSGSKSDHIAFGPDIRFTGSSASNGPLKRSRTTSFAGVGANSSNTTGFRMPGNPNLISRTLSKPESRQNSIPPRYHFLQDAIVGRNSQFHGLTREQRDELGGVEYRAISLLSWVVALYFILWQLIGCLSLGAYMAYNQAEISESNGINPWWLGAFNAVSAFNNSGMSVLDANMVPFQSSYYLLITMGLLILAGNTAYPPFLRFILWTMWRLLPGTEYWKDWKDTLRFALDHPRRVYTNLFPTRQNWWLVLSLVGLNGIDWAAFELLNIGNTAIESVPAGARVLDGLFQALAVRSGGFYIVPISSLRIGVQTLYVGMMYLNVYPVVITMRNSNVYEERSLGIYASDGMVGTGHGETFLHKIKRRLTGQDPDQSRAYFIRQQLKGQLAHDIFWLSFAIFLIVCIEGSNFERDPITYSVFNVIFEVVSGYGCVGITTGLPNEAYSFSGGWHTTSKLILCAVMLRGRHRGLPVAIDRAVLLPGEGGMGRKEEEDYEMRNLSQAITRERAA